MDEVDIIPEQNPVDYSRSNPYQINEDSNDHTPIYLPRLADPIVIRGAGHVTVFALNNKFNEEYPIALTHKVSRDEYQETIKRVNLILRKNVPINFKWCVTSCFHRSPTSIIHFRLLFGCICCCCTIGLSFCPVIC